MALHTKIIITITTAAKRCHAGDPYAYRQVHPTPSIPFFYDFILPPKSKSPKLMFTLLDNDFYLLLNTRKYPLIRDVNSSSI